MSMIETPTSEPRRRLKDDFGLVIMRWESFRVVFNLTMVLICLCYTAIVDPVNFRDPEFWMFMALGGLIANLIFMMGPAFDGYLTWFGIWTAPFALLTFLAGTGLTIFLATDWISRY